MGKSSLILQGGGMRSMYTCGVLDAFMDNDLYINNIYAVSAGCYSALSYLSRQRGRTFRINTKYLNDKRYINMGRLITRGSAVNTDFIFNDVFNELDLFDYDSFKNNCGEFYAVSTDCSTGEALYARVRDLKKDVEYVKASAALPLFTKLVSVDGKLLTDGGISDCVPVKKAIEDGFVNNIVILTVPRDFSFGKNKLMKFYKMKYKKFPNLLKTMEERPSMYNDTLKYIDNLEKENKILVIRPKENLNISNLEKDVDKINRIYEMGYKDGLEYIDRVRSFIK